MIRLSAFTLSALIVYILGIIINIDPIVGVYEKGIDLLVEGEMKKIPFPFLASIAMFTHLSFGIRLYLHAWIIDDYVDLQMFIRRKNWSKKLIELFLRIFWISGTVFIPFIYGLNPDKGMKNLNGVSININFYLLFVGLFLFMWDLLMNSDIKEFSKHRQEEFKINYLLVDFIIVLALAIPCLFSYEYLGALADAWRLSFEPLSIIIIGILSCFQVVYWFPYIKGAHNQRYRY